MTAIQIFGDTPFDMNPARFEALADHQKGELVRLMAERGYGKAALINILGQPVHALVLLRQAHHAYRAVEFERVMPEESAVVQAKGVRQGKGRPKKDELSQRGGRILGLIARHGGKLAISWAALEEAVSIPRSTAPVAIGLLVDMGLIQRVATDSRGTATWALTNEGAQRAGEFVGIGEGGGDA